MATQQMNPRKRKLEAICGKIAMFIVQDTFTDEPDAQQKLSAAIRLLDEVGDMLVKNDADAMAAAMERADELTDGGRNEPGNA